MIEGSQNRFQDAGAICVHFVIIGSVSVPTYAIDTERVGWQERM